MRPQRTEITWLFLCAIPILAFAILWVNWQATDTLPILGHTSPPSISLQVPDANRVLPGPVNDFAREVRDNAIAISIGAAVGLLAVIMLSGVWVDVRVARRQRRIEQLARESEEGGSPLDAPWLRNE